MDERSPSDLIKKLIASNISREEFDRFLAGLDHQEILDEYEEILKAYFDALVVRAQQRDGLNEDENKGSK